MHKFLILVFCLSLSSCVLMIPCKVNLEINNNSDEIVEIEISNYYNGNLYFKLNPSDKIKLNNNDLINSAVILVKAKHNLKYLGYGEYDHWFPIKHRLKIDIDNNEIVFNNDRMAYRELANSYEEYDEYKEYEEYLLNQKYKK